MNLSKFQEIVGENGAWHAVVHGVTKSQTWLSDLTTTKQLPSKLCWCTRGAYCWAISSGQLGMDRRTEDKAVFTQQAPL